MPLGVSCLVRHGRGATARDPAAYAHFRTVEAASYPTTRRRKTRILGRMETTTATRTVQTRRAVGRQLPRRTRKAVLVVHITSAGAWIGLDVVLAVLVVTAATTDSANTKAVSLQALELFAVGPMLVTGLVCLGSGLILGLGTKFGLVRYWWVAVKLVLNIVLVVLVATALRSGVHEAADQARLLATGGATDVAVGDLKFPPIVSPLALMIAATLSVYKPWGRIRRTV